MESLLVEQKAAIEAFNKCYSEFKKGDPSKLPVDELKTKCADVKQKFFIISNRDEVIKQYRTEENKEQPYFAQGSFKDVQALSTKFVSEIDEIIKKKLLRPRLTGFENDFASRDDSLIGMQRNELLELIENADGIDNSSQPGIIKSTLEMLAIVWTEFRTSIYRERAAGNPTPAEYGRMQQRYMECVGKLNDVLDQRSNNNTSPSVAKFSLPKIELPKFHGKPSEWRSFIALFDRMVHNNNSMDNGLKVEYLKTCIKGDAAKLINHLDPAPESYIICYEILRKRFDNKREIMGELINNILNLPKMKNEDGNQLKTLHDTVYECIMAINSIGIDTKNWDHLLTHILLHKLDSVTLMHYECQLKDIREPQKLKDFLSYVENRFMALQSAHSKSDSFNNTKNKTEKKSNEKTMKCLLCNEGHMLYKCIAFGKQSVQERVEWAKSKRLCMNCFSETHKTSECKNNLTCKICKKKHNSLLHIEPKANNNTKANHVNVQINDPNSEIQNETNAHLVINATTTMLATAIVGVEAKDKQKIAMRALIDPGSQSSFISQNALQTLRLKGQSIAIGISGIADVGSSAHSAIEINIVPRFNSAFILNATVIVLKKLTRYENNFDDLKSYDHFKNLCLADPSVSDPAPIDLILGADVYPKILKSGLIKGLYGEPMAQNTEFGWAITGPSNTGRSQSIYANVVALVSNAELDRGMKTFFQSDDFYEEKQMTNEEERCEIHFQKTHARDAAGRYIVRHAFVNGLEFPELGDTRKRAIATQLQLEKRFLKNPKLKIEYEAFINEFIRLGQMELATAIPKHIPYYLPHHCVFKESTTTQLRVVFNASQRSENGKSLNEQLAIGAMQQPNMISLLIQFRFFKYAFTADLEKMYRQILLAKDQRDLQRIIWRGSTNEPLKDYVLNTVTYGTANAPHLATRVLTQVANDYNESFPMAAKIIMTCMYMDDILGGAFSKSELIGAYKQLKEVFKSAGFNLRKWCSNSEELLQIIPENERELRACSENVKALGISWSAIDDEFTFEHKIAMNTKPNTKRMLLSEIFSLFDPLGWICPLIIRAKHLMQLLWKANVGWDTSLSSEFLEPWLKIKAELHLINDLKIPRWIRFMPNEVNELHGFCDASEIGYAAVIYVKNVNSNSISLLIAKARVTPTKDDKEAKDITIPRLELRGAKLLAMLTKQVLDSMKFSFQKIRLYTDSKIVLGWINGNPKRYKTFVANRVAMINDLTNKSNWFHVPSEHNPADCASRGLLPSQLVQHSLWWNGPEFLKTEMGLESGDCVEFISDREMSTNSHAVNAHVSILPNVSSFYRMKRIIAMCFRFKINCEHGKPKSTGLITASELDNAERAIVRYVQACTFEDELKALRKNENMTGKLRRLNPILDAHDIIRVGGRLERAEIPCDAKNPIVLPKGNFVSGLVIHAAHLKCMHGGPRLTEATLRQRFWVLNSQNEVKKITNACINCFKQKGRTLTQAMAHLPKSRVSMCEKVFTNTAVDYTGAFNIKIGKGRGVKTSKAYICIFVCMATKAIHIELVSDLSAETYIAAFRRLIARRGYVKNLFSDNGTCFIKADKDLQCLSLIQEEEFNTEICNELTKCGTAWHFSPPGAPHFNGIAEAGVKSVKSHLKKTIGEFKMTYEEFTTVLGQVEACVNSRPLCAMSSDPNDFESLTPGHFLVGTSLLAPPDESFLETNVNWLSRWQLVQKFSQVLWKRFREEYLTQLQERAKWFDKKVQPRINELVLIKEENVPSCQWPMARILNVHKGDDGLTRIVTIKMKDKIFKRPITKLAPLPIQNDTETQNEIRAHLARVSKPKPLFEVNVLSIVVTMLAIFATTTHSLPNLASNPVTIFRFPTPPGLYFEQTNTAFMEGAEWNAIAVINIRGLHDEFVSIKSHVIGLKSHCLEIFYSGRDQCNNIVTHLEYSIEQLKEVNDMILIEPTRRITKRAVLDPIGDILGDVIGVLGSKFREQYQRDMTKVNDNEEHVLKLIQNNTIVMESTLNILKNESAALKAQNQHIVTLSRQIKNNKNTTEAELMFNTAVTYLEQLLSDYRTQQNALIEILWHTNKNSLNHNLFTPKQVNKLRKIISQHVGSDLLVPEGGDIYKLSKVTAQVMHTQILFNIAIPIPSAQKFKIYKIIQVPRLYNQELFWIAKGPMERFLMVASNREKFQVLENIDDCTSMNDEVMLCQKMHVWNGATTAYCIWNLFNQNHETNCQIVNEPARTVFIELSEQNKFIFACNGSQQLTVICEDKVTYPMLDGEGILQLNENCKLRTFHYEQELMPRTTFDDDTNNEIVIPKFPQFVVPNFGLNVFAKNDSDELDLETATQYNFEELMSIINDTKKNSVLPNALNAHDYHHYTMLYMLVGCILILIIVIWYKFRTIRTIQNVIQTPIAAPRFKVPVRTTEMISMPDLRGTEY